MKITSWSWIAFVCWNGANAWSDESDDIRRIVDAEMGPAMAKVREVYLTLEIEEVTTAEGTRAQNALFGGSSKSVQHFYGSKERNRYRLDRLEPETRKILSSQLGHTARIAKINQRGNPKGPEFRLDRVQYLNDPMEMWKPLSKQWSNSKRAPAVVAPYTFFTQRLLDSPVKIDPSYATGIFSWGDEKREFVKFFFPLTPPNEFSKPGDGLTLTFHRKQSYVPISYRVVYNERLTRRWDFAYDGDVEGVPLIRKMEHEQYALNGEVERETADITLIRRAETTDETFSLAQFGFSDSLNGVPSKPRRSYWLMGLSTLVVVIVVIFGLGNFGRRAK